MARCVMHSDDEPKLQLRASLTVNVTLVGDDQVITIHAGETIELDLRTALRALFNAPVGALKILHSIPLVPGLSITWADGDQIKGPTPILEIEQSADGQLVLVSWENGLRWIPASEVLDRDPLPEVARLLDAGTEELAAEGPQRLDWRGPSPFAETIADKIMELLGLKDQA